MDSIVKNSMRYEINSNITIGNVANAIVRLPYDNKIALCVIRANNENRMDMLLRCPMNCAENKFLFALVLSLGEHLLFRNNFQEISSTNMTVLLGQLTMHDVNDKYNKMKNRNGQRKIYMEVSLSIKIVPLTPLQRLLQQIASPEQADFTFEVGNKKLLAHKFILSARSPVFARMLSNNSYKETQQSAMIVTDTKACTFEIFLGFIYKAEVPDLTVFGAVELIKLAEKYDFQDLKSICESLLVNKLDQCDCFNVYLMAHQHNCSQKLITKAFDLVEKKFFIGKQLPSNLWNNPTEVQRLVTKMREFDETLQDVHENLINPAKKMKEN